MCLVCMFCIVCVMKSPLLYICSQNHNQPLVNESETYLCWWRICVWCMCVWACTCYPHGVVNHFSAQFLSKDVKYQHFFINICVSKGQKRIHTVSIMCQCVICLSSNFLRVFFNGHKFLSGYDAQMCYINFTLSKLSQMSQRDYLFQKAHAKSWILHKLR